MSGSDWDLRTPEYEAGLLIARPQRSFRISQILKTRRRMSNQTRTLHNLRMFQVTFVILTVPNTGSTAKLKSSTGQEGHVTRRVEMQKILSRKLQEIYQLLA